MASFDLNDVMQLNYRDLPVHDHGVESGFTSLVWTAAIPHAAVALLCLTAGTSLLHCIQHRSTRL